MKTIIFDKAGNKLRPGDNVIHDDGRSGVLIYNPRSDSHRFSFKDKSQLEAKNMETYPVIKVSLAWKVPQIKVKYYDLEIVVPNSAEYVAIDSIGNVYAYLVKPEMVKDHWSTEESNYWLGVMHINGLDWKQSLIKVKA